MLWFTLVLYLHLLAVVAAFASAGYVHLGLDGLRRALTAKETQAAAQRAARGAAGALWAGVALLFTGACLAQTGFHWTAPWVDFSILGLVVLEVAAGVCSRRLRRLSLMLAARDPLVRLSSSLLSLLTLTVMLMMIIKAGALANAFMLLAAFAAGAGLSRRHLSLPSHNSISA